MRVESRGGCGLDCCFVLGVGLFGGPSVEVGGLMWFDIVSMSGVLARGRSAAGTINQSTLSSGQASLPMPLCTPYLQVQIPDLDKLPFTVSAPSCLPHSVFQLTALAANPHALLN